MFISGRLNTRGRRKSPLTTKCYSSDRASCLLGGVNFPRAKRVLEVFSTNQEQSRNSVTFLMRFPALETPAARIVACVAWRFCRTHYSVAKPQRRANEWRSPHPPSLLCAHNRKTAVPRRLRVLTLNSD